MSYILLIGLVILVAAQSIIKKQYNLKAVYPKVYFFSAVTAFAEVIFFAAMAGFRFDFTPEIIPYSLFFAITFSAMLIGGFLSIKYGPLSITMLIISYSLLIPTLYGIIVLDERLSKTGVAGIVLLLISLFMIGAKKEKLSFSFKWLISVAVTFFANGISSVILKQQPLDFGGAYKNEFMMISMLISGIILLAASLINKESIGKEKLLCITFGAGNGVSNALVNLLVMLLTGVIPNAILFPAVSAGGIILGFIMALFVYKEKLSRMQLTGYFTGILSIILLRL